MGGSFDMFVIGGGVAGMAAAEAAAAAGLRVALAEANMFGGLVLNVNHLSPGPAGMPASGSDLSAEMMMRLSDLGVELLFEPVSALRPGADGRVELDTASGPRRARHAVLASGARNRRLGIPGEETFAHRGLSYCADCDGPLFRGKPVMVVGGGDSALQEALVLADFCPVVHLVHRGTAFTARPDLVAAVAAAPAIRVRFGAEVAALGGDDVLTTVRLRENGAEVAEPCAGVFPFVGLVPNADLLPAAALDDAGAVAVDAQMETRIPGVLAVGAVRAGYGGMLTDALADGRAAAARVVARCAG